ncbi:hypothetical protein I2485_11355 [Nesterenkonia sp. E16_7]|uniref:hypothetical protein n=1 Tax=unclassified Nesterenkonia TaxID=2629769 RepID=UPI001A90F0F5|nr:MULTISPECIES: hypothetical protein [unclassified Nesterenkonia]MBO0596157.1 hypothetical protein [Nesterenkonia sp. E16_10]MBO0599239.1 hypothetical protein [Nesterenkonia sp. E16_7]
MAVARVIDAIENAYLPGLTMPRMADLHAGSAKTDDWGAFIIGTTARTMPPRCARSPSLMAKWLSSPCWPVSMMTC